jgi:succinoglycan biosynthesis transport protein ExoP
VVHKFQGATVVDWASKIGRRAEEDVHVQQDSEGLNFEQALRALRRRAPLILLCVVLAAGAAFGFSKRQTKQYTATASVDFSNNPVSQQIAGLSDSGSGSLAQQASNVELVKLGDTAAKTAILVGHGLTAEAVSEGVSVAGQGESNVVDVSATMASPTLAAATANTYARQFVKAQQRANTRYLKSALALVNRQLAALSPAQRLGEDGLNLQDRAQTLTFLAGLKYGDVQMAQEALAPSSPSSPKTSRNTALGALLGLLIGLALALMLERLDRRVKRPEDLEAIYHLPLVGEVPKSGSLTRSARDTKGGKAGLLPVEAEAFNLIRAHLRFFNVDRDLRTIVIASAAPGDGKTTIALNLAKAAARLGSRVLLLEADLRHPTLVEHLDIQPGMGLADVLIGAVQMGVATESVALDAPPGEGAEERTLDLLAAGVVLPPNPGELIESRAMESVLEHARSTYDLVVIDTPPLTAVSDAFPLLTKVDGVVIVGWVGRSRHDAAERLHQILASSGAPLLGVIANGVKSGGPSPYPGDDKSSLAFGTSSDRSSSSSPSSSKEFAPTIKS